MSTRPRRPTKSHQLRTAWPGPGREELPACPGCGRPLELSQPDPRSPGQLLGRCADNPLCGEWVVFTKREGRWHCVERITADQRRNPTWPVARPASEDTARRA